MKGQSLLNEKFLEVGFIRKSHGYKGQIKIVLFDSFAEDLSPGQFIFIEQANCKIPFQIEEVHYEKDIILKLEWINSDNEVKAYLGAALFIISDQTDINQAKENGLSSFIGYTIIDEQFGDLGIILRVDKYPQQDMAILKIENNEVLIPLHEDLIIKIDQKNKVIKMALPDGITDINEKGRQV